MEKYKSQKKSHGVSEYSISDSSISVRFINSSKIYTYSYRKAGKYHVEKMKPLARAGKGLSAYISQNVRDLFDE